jgi:hypothetical protein
MRFAAGHSAATAAVSAAAAALTEGVLKTMILSQWKSAGAALCVAVGVISTGALLQAQQPAATPPAGGLAAGTYRADGGAPDRLAELERKLDRVLSALERVASSPKLIDGPPGAVAIYDRATDADPAAVPKRPEGALPKGKSVSADTLYSVPLPPGSGGGAMARDSLPARVRNLESRLDAIERRLGVLEQRRSETDRNVREEAPSVSVGATVPPPRQEDNGRR